jgi:DNA-binding LytR/AlgR family response regulator
MNNKMLTAIIVEDEEYPRLALEYKLKTYHPGVRLLDSCGDCESALASILKHQPDMLFLDIELPDRDSLSLLRELKEVSTVPLPHVIFTTAYDNSDYLLKAIRLEAVDYLLKPVAPGDLAEAIRKVRHKTSDKQPATVEKEEKVFILRGLNSFFHIKKPEMVYCESDGNYSRIHLADNTSEEVFESMLDLERLMCDSHILRLGRKYILNTRYIHRLEYKSNLCQLQLPGGIRKNLFLPKKQTEQLLQFVEEGKRK